MLLGLFQALDGGFELVHGLLEDTARAAHVAAHVAIAGGAEHRALVHRQPGLVADEVDDTFMAQSQTRAVEPRCFAAFSYSPLS